MESAVDHAARAEMAQHAAVCTERYGSLWKAVTDLNSSMTADRVARAAADLAIHTRFNVISERMWVAVASVCGAAILMLLAGTGFLIAHLMQRGTH